MKYFIFVSILFLGLVFGFSTDKVVGHDLIVISSVIYILFGLHMLKDFYQFSVREFLIHIAAYLLYGLRTGNQVVFCTAPEIGDYRVTGFYCTFFTKNCRWRPNNFWQLGVFLKPIGRDAHDEYPSITVVRKII